MKVLFFITAAFIQLVSLHAQNVGIGTNNPARAKLEVHGVADNGSTSAIFGGESTGVSIQRNWPTIGFNQYHTASGSKYIGNGAAGIIYLDPHNGGLFFDMYPPGGTTNAPAPTPKRALSLFGNGRASIGPTITNSNLTVSRTFSDESTACFAGTVLHSVFNYGNKQDTYIRGGIPGAKVYINDNSLQGDVIIGDGTAFVGINNHNPLQTLDIRQSAGRGLAITETENLNKWEFRVGSDAALRLYGNYEPMGLFINPGGQYFNYSDRRRKKNIVPLPFLMDKLMQLEPVNYELKEDSTGQKTIGFIAQDVKPLFPELVKVTADTVGGQPMDHHSINYNGFSVIAIKAIQEQQVTIRSLEAAVQKQQADIDGLKRIVDVLVKQVYHKE